jgi:hypothetical protein
VWLPSLLSSRTFLKYNNGRGCNSCVPEASVPATERFCPFSLGVAELPNEVRAATMQTIRSRSSLFGQGQEPALSQMSRVHAVLLSESATVTAIPFWSGGSRGCPFFIRGEDNR